MDIEKVTALIIALTGLASAIVHLIQLINAAKLKRELKTTKTALDLSDATLATVIQGIEIYSRLPGKFEEGQSLKAKIQKVANYTGVERVKLEETVREITDLLTTTGILGKNLDLTHAGRAREQEAVTAVMAARSSVVPPAKPV